MVFETIESITSSFGTTPILSPGLWIILQSTTSPVKAKSGGGSISELAKKISHVAMANSIVAHVSRIACFANILEYPGDRSSHCLPFDGTFFTLVQSSVLHLLFNRSQIFKKHISGGAVKDFNMEDADRLIAEETDRVRAEADDDPLPASVPPPPPAATSCSSCCQEKRTVIKIDGKGSFIVEKSADLCGGRAKVLNVSDLKTPSGGKLKQAQATLDFAEEIVRCAYGRSVIDSLGVLCGGQNKAVFAQAVLKATSNKLLIAEFRRRNPDVGFVFTDSIPDLWLINYVKVCVDRQAAARLVKV
jgi:hypothetical protein